MRILWLTPYLPLPTFGGGTRVFNLIKALAVTCEIDLIASDEISDEASLALLRPFCRHLEVLPRPGRGRARKRLLQVRSLASRKSAQHWLLHSGEVQARIDDLTRAHQYDAVILEHSFMGCYTLPAGVPIVLDQHNLESDILWRSSQRERSALRRVYNLAEYRKYCREEQAICCSSRLILTTSTRDRDMMRDWWRDLPDCVVVPNGVDGDYFAPDSIEHTDCRPGSVVFVGAMHYAPNTEAMLFFVERIWPRIQQRAPQTSLTIAGGSPPREIRQLEQRPNITVVGQVPDVRPYLANAQVVVAPLRIGGGTRLKILEAMAMERPVVSTAIGCEGLDVKDGEHLLIADDPETFADRTVALLQDPKQCAALGRAGRRLVEQAYDWHALGAQMATAIGELQHRGFRQVAAG